jgi:hypothetical protein
MDRKDRFVHVEGGFEMDLELATIDLCREAQSGPI